MKKQLLFLLFLGFALPVLAQNKAEDRIQLARKLYAEGKDKIAYNANKDTPYNYSTVVRKQNWPATGQRTETTEFYYDEIESDEEPYPVGYALCMVCNSYNVTVRNHQEEYVYDDKGNPLFYYIRYDEILSDDLDKLAKIELRQYYGEDGSVIRTLYKMSDKSGKMMEINEKSHPEVVEGCQFLLQFAKDNFAHFKAVFDAIYNFEFSK